MTKKKENRSDKPLRTALDEKSMVLFFEDMQLMPPDGVGVFDEPTRCRTVNLEWDKIISGAVRSQLLTIAAWRDATDESYNGIQEVLKYLSSDDCGGGDCTIEILLADDEFFQDVYVPVTFGEYYAETIDHYETLLAAHDGTPQSVAPDVPVAAPNESESNALCYAVNRFVELYSSQKLCLIQSKNFLEVFWTNLASAVNEFYNVAINLMQPFYSPNIFSCFTNDSEAMTALADESAIEELACFIYDELQSVVMSQSHFDSAILDAATTLSGNAAAIACLMQNDNSEELYISFLQGYNIALQRIASGETLDCPCVDDTHQLWIWNFNQGIGDFQIIRGSLSGGVLVGTDIGNQHIVELRMNFNPAWRVRNVQWTEYREGAITHGNLDTGSIRLRPFPTLNDNSVFFGGGFMPNGELVRCFVWNATAYTTGHNELYFFGNVADDNIAPNSRYELREIRINFTRGYAKGGYLHSDDNIC